MQTQSHEKTLTALTAATAVLALFLAFNIYTQVALAQSLSTTSQRIADAESIITAKAGLASGIGDGKGEASFLDELIPKGVPAIYGEELGVTFDDPVGSLDILKKLDGDLYKDGLIKFSDLSPEAQQVYVDVGLNISCEYCCSAKSLVFEDGRVACGCAHSAGMRGLAKYLLLNHPDKYDAESILAELTDWKTMFFPKQTIQKAIKLQAENGEITPEMLNEIPDMVGGC